MISIILQPCYLGYALPSRASRVLVFGAGSRLPASGASMLSLKGDELCRYGEITPGLLDSLARLLTAAIASTLSDLL